MLEKVKMLYLSAIRGMQGITLTPEMDDQESLMSSEEAICHDWEMIGQDFQRAIDKVGAKYGEKVA